jgi:hypothetical protein
LQFAYSRFRDGGETLQEASHQQTRFISIAARLFRTNSSTVFPVSRELQKVVVFHSFELAICVCFRDAPDCRQTLNMELA